VSTSTVVFVDGPTGDKDETALGGPRLDMERLRADSARATARYHLARNVRRARVALMTPSELVEELKAICSRPDPKFVLEAVTDYPEPWNEELQAASVAALFGLMSESHRGRDAVLIDRTVGRVLPRLTGLNAHIVAREALGSVRSRRRIAAWRYYRVAGLDDDARQVLAQQFDRTDHQEFLKLVAGDGQLAATVGVSLLFGRLKQLYWRSRVVEAALYHDQSAAADFREQHPAEWLWAVARKGDLFLVPQVLAVLEARREDADIVNRAVLCVLTLADRRALEVAVSVGEGSLDDAVAPWPDQPDPS
jgi:hypothetical protein